MQFRGSRKANFAHRETWCSEKLPMIGVGGTLDCWRSRSDHLARLLALSSLGFTYPFRDHEIAMTSIRSNPLSLVCLTMRFRGCLHVAAPTCRNVTWYLMVSSVSDPCCLLAILDTSLCGAPLHVTQSKPQCRAHRYLDQDWHRERKTLEL